MNILDSILEHTRKDIAFSKKSMPLDRLKELPGFKRQPVSLPQALRGADISVIAEIKKASPSKGIIRNEFEPVSLAKDYAVNGARAISVLTEKKFFLGDIHCIANIRPEISIPILRKDFIVDSYQLTEAKAFGADAVLLIVAALEPSCLHELHIEANELGMDCLVEVHSERELDSLNFDLVQCIGINNRNLSDFSVDFSITLRIAPHIPHTCIIVSESGISKRTDLELLRRHGIHAVLIGESLMRAKNPGEELTKLLTPTTGNAT